MKNNIKKQSKKLLICGGILSCIFTLSACKNENKNMAMHTKHHIENHFTKKENHFNHYPKYHYHKNLWNNEKTKNSKNFDNELPTKEQAEMAYSPVKAQIGNGKYNNYGAYVLNNNKSTLSAKNNNATFAANTLDNENRPSTANAFLNHNTRQYKNRNETNNGATTWKPAGYHQLTGLSGKYRFAYNRGHLLAYALTGNIKGFNASESNHKNIVTQTSWSNQAGSPNNTGQNYYEGIVRKALDQNEKVKYQVTPIYNKNNIVPNGMHIQAKSTDNKINFNVFIPNIQNNININYANGVAKAK